MKRKLLKIDDNKHDISSKQEKIITKPFIWNTDLVSKNAFDVHLLLYENYVNQTNNKIKDSQLDTYNANGVLLHEIYFDNITKINDSKSGFIVDFFNDNFNSYENWKENFTNLSMQIQSKGWVALIYDAITNTYKNIKMTSHDCGLSVNCKIIYLLDMFEHAIVIDYGANKKQYIEKSFQCINWDVVENRIKTN